MLGTILTIAFVCSIMAVIAFFICEEICFSDDLKLWCILAVVVAVILAIVLYFYDSCPACGCVDSGRYCTECGVDKHPPKDSRRCPECGKVHDLYSEYCANCGAHLKEEVNEK